MTTDRAGHQPGCVLQHEQSSFDRCANSQYDYLPKPPPADPGKPLLTGGDICRMRVRIDSPWITDKTEVDEAARVFFNASPSGELWHVFAARRVPHCGGVYR